MKKAICFTITLIMLISITLSTNIWDSMVSAETVEVEVPIKNPSFEEEPIGNPEDLRFSSSNPNAEQGYVMPGWSVYHDYTPNPENRYIYDSDKTFDGAAEPTDGEKCMNFIDKGQGMLHYWSDPFPVKENHKYILSYDIYSEVGDAFAGLIFFNEIGQLLQYRNNVSTAYDDNVIRRDTSYFPKWIGENRTSSPKDNTWQTFSGEITSYPDAAYARIVFKRGAANTVNTSVDNVRLTTTAQLPTISQPTFGGHVNELFPNENININVNVLNETYKPFPVFLIACVYNDYHQLFNISAASNFDDNTRWGDINLTIKMPEDVSDKYIETMVLDISEGRIKPYYNTVRFPN